jgi:5-methylcytosine-specific restriction endonuclease McrA
MPNNDWTDKELLACFRMPGGFAITGRTTSIRNVFVAAIVPVIRPSSAEIRTALEILALDPRDLRCSYCGDVATEWDHLRPLVKLGKPTGYPSSIRNLVPSCGKCNQSKGKSDWKVWMLGKAPRAPSIRKIPDLEQRIARLEKFEAWSGCIPLKIEEIVSPELWQQYYALQEDILQKMRAAQKLAAEISREIKAREMDVGSEHK